MSPIAVAVPVVAVPPLGWHTALTRYEFAPVVTAGLLLAAAAYLVGVARVRRRHPRRPWPLRSTLAFLAGLLVVAVATESAVGAYDDVLFADHMVQHLLLIMVAPPLLVLGRPVTLLLHASRNPVHRLALRAVRSAPVQVLTHPVVATAAFTATIVGTHLTGFMNVTLTSPTVHAAEHALYLVVGYLFFLPLVGREPIRWRVPAPLRLVVYLVAMPVDAFTGIALLQVGTEPFPAYLAQHRTWGPGPLADVHLGGAIMWVGGDGIMMVAAVATALTWLTRARPAAGVGGFLEAARSAALGARTGTPPVPVDSAEALAAYNAHLAALAGGRGPVAAVAPRPPGADARPAGPPAGETGPAD